MPFITRLASIRDVSALAALHVETFNETHGSYPDGPGYELRKYQWEKSFQEVESWFCYVVEDEMGKLVGFAKGQVYNNPDHAEYQGELNKIYLLRSHQKIGLGRQLICLVANEFVRSGINSMLLFGDANNPSNHFYEYMGGKKLFSKKGEFHGGYGWENLQKLIAQCVNKH